MKDRLDIIMTGRNMTASREKARATIMAGLVYVDGERMDKPGAQVDVEAEITIKEDLCPYVSRGGLKLEKAIELFGFSLDGCKAVDIAPLQEALQTVCLKTERKSLRRRRRIRPLDWKLRNDERVVNMEKTNIRYLDTELIDDDIDFISIDVSFISLKLVFPVAAKLLSDKGALVCLVKPQFEAGRSK